MLQKLTKREKTLIFIVIIAVFFFLPVHFAIVPMFKLYSEKQIEFDSLYLEKEQIDLKLLSESITRLGFNKAEENFNDIKEHYPPFMPNEEIDRVLTRLCLENDIAPTSLGISNAVVFDGSSSSNREKIFNSQSKDAYIIIVRANMNLSGSYDALKKLISAVELIDYIRISRVNFIFPRTGSLGKFDSSNFTVSFELTMLNSL